MLSELFKTEERSKILRYVMFRSSFGVAEVSRATRHHQRIGLSLSALSDGAWLIAKGGAKVFAS